MRIPSVFLLAVTGVWAAVGAAAPHAVSAPAPTAPAAEVPEAAAKACFEGRWLLVQNRLDEALEKLQLALDLAPGYVEAEQLLAKARARRQEAQTHYDRAAAALQEEKWDKAVQEVAAATNVFPKYREAKALLEDIQRKAAAAYLAAGLERLEAGDLAAAEVALGRAQDYVADLPGVREGLARAASMRAEAALARQQWGQALLWAREAVASDAKEEYQAQVQAAQARVFARIRFGVTQAAPEAGGPSAATAALAAGAWRRLQERKPEFVLLPAAGAAPEAAAFTVRLEAGKLDILTERTRIENRTHRYTVRQDEPNPDYARIRDLLDAATQRLAALRTEVVDRPCYTCSGTGWLLCRACGGTGAVGGAPCAACGSSGRPGWVRCPLCGGLGRRIGLLGTDIRRLEREVDQLQDQLARTPPRIVREVPADWAYGIEYYEKTGTVEATVRVTDAASGRAILADALRRHRREEDTTIQNANPAIGLAAKPLRLPPDEAVREGLLAEAGDEAAARVLAAVLAARAAERQAASDRLLAEGKVAEAVEAGTDAAVLREPIDPQKAGLQMKGLRDRLRIEERYPDGPPAPPPPPAPA